MTRRHWLQAVSAALAALVLGPRARGRTATSPPALGLGQARRLVLGEAPVEVPIALDPAERRRLRALVAGQAATARVSSALRLVLEGVRLTDSGRAGGYYYKVLLGVAGGGADAHRMQVDTLGPFEISSAQQAAGDHSGDATAPVRLTMPLTDTLRRLAPEVPARLYVAFVRVDGGHAPKGPAITIERFRVVADAPAS